MAVCLAPVMGRRTVRSGDPAENSDRAVRGVLIERDEAASVVVGRRLTIRCLGAEVYP